METQMSKIIQTLGVQDTFSKITGCAGVQTYITERTNAGLCLEAIKLEFCMILLKVKCTTEG